MFKKILLLSSIALCIGAIDGMSSESRKSRRIDFSAVMKAAEQQISKQPTIKSEQEALKGSEILPPPPMTLEQAKSSGEKSEVQKDTTPKTQLNPFAKKPAQPSVSQEQLNAEIQKSTAELKEHIAKKTDEVKSEVNSSLGTLKTQVASFSDELNQLNQLKVSVGEFESKINDASQSTKELSESLDDALTNQEELSKVIESFNKRILTIENFVKDAQEATE